MIEIDGLPEHEKALRLAMVAADFLVQDPSANIEMRRGTVAALLAALVRETTQNLISEGQHVSDFDPAMASAQQKREALAEFGIRLI